MPSPTWSQAAYLEMFGPLGSLPIAGGAIYRPNLGNPWALTGGTNKVTVGPGAGIVPGPDAAVTGGYPWQSVGSVDVAVPAVATGLSRIDLVCVQLTDTAAPPNADLVLVPGVASASPVAPSWPAGVLQIGSVRIADTGVVTATYAPTLIAPLGAQIATSNLAWIGNPYKGQLAYRTTDDTRWFYDGAAWQPRDNGPKGQVVNAVPTADTSGVTTTETNLNGMGAVTATMKGTGRRVKVSLDLGVLSTVAGDEVRVRVYDGATTIIDKFMTLTNAGRAQPLQGAFIIQSNWSGSHTLRATMVRSAGSGSLTMQNARSKGGLLVEDIGV